MCRLMPELVDQLLETKIAWRQLKQSNLARVQPVMVFQAALLKMKFPSLTLLSFR